MERVRLEIYREKKKRHRLVIGLIHSSGKALGYFTDQIFFTSKVRQHVIFTGSGKSLVIVTAQVRPRVIVTAQEILLNCHS